MELRRGTRNIVVILLFLAVIAALPGFISSYLLRILILTFFNATIAVAWNIISGYAKELSLGHSVFFGIGAYTSAMLYLYYGVSPIAGLFVGMALSALLAALVGLLTLRLVGTFFTLMTLALVEIFRVTFLYFKDITHGALGIIFIGKDDPFNLFFTSPTPFYYLALALLLIAVGVSFLIERSKIYYYLVAIGDDLLASRSVGINVLKYKTYALILSAILTAPVGTLYSQFILYITPDGMFSIPYSIKIAVMGMIGGAGLLLGPLVGSVILTILELLLTSYLSEFFGLNLVIYGVLLVVTILYMPEGIIGYLRKKMGGKK